MTFGGPLGSDEIQMMVHAYLFEDGGFSGLTIGTTQFTQPTDTVN